LGFVAGRLRIRKGRRWRFANSVCCGRLNRRARQRCFDVAMSLASLHREKGGSRKARSQFPGAGFEIPAMLNLCR